MWSLIEIQQLIVLLLMFHVETPVATAMFFGAVFEIAAFDFFEVEPWTNWLLKLEPSGPFNDSFDTLGMGSLYVFNNLGSFGLFFTLYLLLLLMIPLIRCGPGLSRRA